MTDPPPSGSPALAPRPLRIVPDANALTGQIWVDRFIRESEAGRIQLYWSPKILEEVGRVRLWIWIKKVPRREPTPTGSSAWKSLWRRYSDEAHIWFARLSPLVQVIEDQPPHEPAWIAPLPDPNDAWLWNTARRARADIVVSMNLKDGPATDVEGTQQYEHIAYVHPNTLRIILDVWSDIIQTGEIPDDLDRVTREAVGSGSTHDVQTVVALIRAILARLAEADAAP